MQLKCFFLITTLLFYPFSSIFAKQHLQLNLELKLNNKLFTHSMISLHNERETKFIQEFGPEKTSILLTLYPKIVNQRNIELKVKILELKKIENVKISDFKMLSVLDQKANIVQKTKHPKFEVMELTLKPVLTTLLKKKE